MKKVLLFAILVLTVLTLGSCGKKDGIYFFNFKPEIAEKYEEIARVYEEETGVPVRVVTAASGTYEQTLKSEIVKSDAPAIFQINGPVGYAAWKEYCLDLKDSELYKHLTDKTLAITDGNGVYGIPYVVEGYGIIYNQELTDKYFALSNRATTYTSMNDVRSFAALKAVVEDMTAHKEELGIDGVFASTSLKSGEDWRFHTHLANVPLYYEFLDRGVDLKNPESYANVEFSYAEGFKNLFDLYINNSVTDKKLLGSKQVSDSMAEFALGRCAMVQNGNWAYSQIASVEGNTVKADKVHFLPLYIGTSEEESQGLCTGTEGYFAVNKNLDAATQKKALDFLTWLYTSETGKGFVTEELDFIAPFDTFDEGDKPKDPLAREVSNWLEKEDVYNIPWAFTVFPGQNFKNDFGSALLGYAQGSVTWDDVKNTVTRRWKEEAASLLS